MCVDTWYSGPEIMTKTCPVCRAERGLNETMSLRGLTEFMEGIQKLYRSDGSNEQQRTQDEAH